MSQWTQYQPYSPPVAPAPEASAPRVPWWRPTPLWVGLLILSVLLGATASAILYLDDSRLLASNRRLDNELQTAKAHVTQLNAQNADLDTRLKQEAEANESLRKELKNPTLEIWNVPQTIDGPSYLLEGGLPDTFTYHLRATSEGAPMSISLMSYEQYGNGLDCIHNGRGSTHYCMTHTGIRHWTNVTSVNEDIHEAEGCAGYVLVWTAAVKTTVRPDISVTYNPADHGTC
jgi:hypothetical protein